MKLKNGKIDIVAFMFLAVIAGLLIMGIFGEPIKKAFAAVTDPLLKKIGLDDDSEQEEVEKELLNNAKEVFNNFKNVIEHCKNSPDLNCACGKIDFTQLNQYSLMLSNKRDTGNTYLNLLGSDGLPVLQEDITPTMGNFPTLPKDIYENNGKRNEYLAENNDFIFSIEKVIYKKQDLSEEEKFNGKMNSIYFLKPESGFTIFDKYDNNKIPAYICRSFSCCGEVPVSSEFTSACSDICSTIGCITGIDNRGISKECSDSFGFEEDHPADDYCICGTGSEKVIPVPDDYSLTCFASCMNKEKGCVTGIDDGGNDKKCNEAVGFEGNDDYCICGNGFEEAVPAPPSNFNSACNSICSAKGKGCVMGIDDGNKNRECSVSFQFEGGQTDDYCICGTESEKAIPAPPTINNKCDTLCSNIGKVCMAGIDDGDNNKKCSDNFGFEGNDDYCICGTDSEKLVPVPDNFNSACNTICSAKGKGCVTGIDDGNTDKGCSTPVGFEGNDDYCLCGSSEKIYGIPG